MPAWSGQLGKNASKQFKNCVVHHQTKVKTTTGIAESVQDCSVVYNQQRMESNI